MVGSRVVVHIVTVIVVVMQWRMHMVGIWVPRGAGVVVMGGQCK